MKLVLLIMARRVFLSFDAEDKTYVELFRGQVKNPNLEIDFYDSSLKKPINSTDADYIKSQIRSRIDSASVTLCLIGYNTHKSDWVEWELFYANMQKKGLVGVRIHSSSLDSIPPKLSSYNGIIVNWALNAINNAIETAAKRAGY